MMPYSVLYFIATTCLLYTLCGCSTQAHGPQDTHSSAVLTDLDEDGFTTAQGDCDDDDDTRFPAAEDASIDGVDQDCDGIDGPDADGDGHIDVAAGGDDCDDQDPDATLTDTDPDCDGVEAWGDCDDYDPFSTTTAEDADCNGYVDWPCTSLKFDGLNDKVESSFSPVLTVFSLEMWVQFPLESTQRGGIIDMEGDVGGDVWRILLTAECKVRVEMRKEGSGTRHLEYAASLCDAQWHHITLIRDESKIRLFVDGREEDNHNFTYTPLSSTGTFRLGYSPIHTEENTAFEGLIHSVHLNQAILYEQDFSPKQPVGDENTLLLWSLSEGSGNTTLSEYSGVEGSIDGAVWIEACPYGL